MLRIEFALAVPRADGPMTACGLIAVNPPWTLEGELGTVLPALQRALAPDGGGLQRVDWLTAGS
jgi:23S rRNA (adenine2030-N6)-methyltransferase